MPSYQLATVQVTSPPSSGGGVGPSLMMAAAPSTSSSTGPDTGPVQISALPLEVDLDLYKGDDFWLDLIVYAPDGSDADLSWATPSAQVRAVPNAEDIIAAFEAVVDGNLIHLHLPHSEAAKLVPSCAWDAQIAALYTGATFTGTWSWTTDTTSAGDDGQLGMVGSTWAGATEFYVNVADINGVNIEGYLAQIQAGQSIRVEVAGDESSPFGLAFGDYTVSAAPSLAGPTWWGIPVTLNSSHGSPPDVDGTPVTLTMPTAAITTLVAGSVTTKGEVTMP